MDDLAQWLGEQLDADAEDARRGYLTAEPLPDHDGWDTSTTAGLPPAVATRVLREIDAKRRTSARHSPHVSGSTDCATRCKQAHPGAQVCNHDGYRWPCPDVRDLADCYAHRPGYLEDWRP